MKSNLKLRVMIWNVSPTKELRTGMIQKAGMGVEISWGKTQFKGEMQSSNMKLMSRTICLESVLAVSDGEATTTHLRVKPSNGLVIEFSM